MKKIFRLLDVVGVIWSKRPVSMVGLTSTFKLHFCFFAAMNQTVFSLGSPYWNLSGRCARDTDCECIDSCHSSPIAYYPIKVWSFCSRNQWNKACSRFHSTPGLGLWVSSCEFEVQHGSTKPQQITTVLGLKVKKCFQIGGMLFTSHVQSPMLPCRCFSDELQRHALAGWLHRKSGGRTCLALSMSSRNGKMATGMVWQTCFKRSIGRRTPYKASNIMTYHVSLCIVSAFYQIDCQPSIIIAGRVLQPTFGVGEKKKESRTDYRRGLAQRSWYAGAWLVYVFVSEFQSTVPMTHLTR